MHRLTYLPPASPHLTFWRTTAPHTTPKPAPWHLLPPTQPLPRHTLNNCSTQRFRWVPARRRAAGQNMGAWHPRTSFFYYEGLFHLTSCTIALLHHASTFLDSHPQHLPPAAQCLLRMWRPVNLFASSTLASPISSFPCGQGGGTLPRTAGGGPWTACTATTHFL